MATLFDIVHLIDDRLQGFNKNIPAIQRSIYERVIFKLRQLDLNGNNIKATVKNMKLIADIKAELTNLILTPQFKGSLSNFVLVFGEVETFLNEQFSKIEKNYKPPTINRELKKQAVADVITRMTDRGIGAQITDAIGEILRKNVSVGSSYQSLANQLRETLMNTESSGIVERYAKQITTDAVNQYTASSMKNISAGLGYEWYKYSGKDIDTTRPFCDAMTDKVYFHISEVPDLLKAKNLYYSDNKTNTEKLVPLNPKSGLPSGMIPGTDATSFFIYRGGYNCGHQIFPVNEMIVPASIKNAVYATASYKRWAAANGVTA